MTGHNEKDAPRKSPEKASGPDGNPSRAAPAGLRWLIPQSSYGWALLTALLLTAWFLTGNVIVGGRQAENNAAPSAKDTKTATAKPPETASTFSVQTRLSTARTRRAELSLRGRTEADAHVEVKAQTAGVVELIHKGKGTRVPQGALLCLIEAGPRNAEVARAEATLAQATHRYTASRKLARKGHVSETRLLTDKADRDAARAALDKARLDLAYTKITAPFSGFVEAQPAKPGDYLQVGGTCATLVKLDPLLVRANVPEADVSKLKPGQSANARLVTGQTVSGKIRYISSVAEAKTRTFKIEIEIANPRYRLRDGVTAAITLPLATDRAHFLPPSLLVLDDTGRVGARLVDAGGVVRFHPLEILSNDKDGVWVSGLPETAQIITVGQDYVREGQKVQAEKGPPLEGPPTHAAALKTQE